MQRQDELARHRQHDRHGLPRADSGLRPLPRSQVRSRFAEGLLCRAGGVRRREFRRTRPMRQKLSADARTRTRRRQGRTDRRQGARWTHSRARSARPPIRAGHCEPASDRTAQRRNVRSDHDRSAVRFTILATNSSEPCLDELEIYDATERMSRCATSRGQTFGLGDAARLRNSQARAHQRRADGK